MSHQSSSVSICVKKTKLRGVKRGLKKMANSAVVAQQKQTNGKRATEIHGCAYLVLDSLRSPAQSVFRVPGLPPVCFCPVHLCRAPFFYIQSISRRSLSPARNHRLTGINTDEAQIINKKSSVSYLSPSVSISAKNSNFFQIFFRIFCIFLHF